MPNPDTKGLISCAISVTNEHGDITFASIYIEYYYDEDIPGYNPGGEDDDVITRKEHQEALQKLYWAIAQIILGAIGGGILIWLIARKKYQRNDD
jgi:hypothetical protein